MVYEDFAGPRQQENKDNSNPVSRSHTKYTNDQRNKEKVEKAGSLNITPYQLYRYIVLYRESHLAKCPNALFTSSVLIQNQRFKLKSAKIFR